MIPLSYIRIRPLLIIICSLLLVGLFAWITQKRTAVQPKADVSSSNLENLLQTSPLPTVLIVTPPESLPTPICRRDDKGCVICCTKENAQYVCQNKICPL